MARTLPFQASRRYPAASPYWALAAWSCSFQQALVMPFPPEIHHPQQSGMCFKAADVLMDQIPRHPPAGRCDIISYDAIAPAHTPTTSQTAWEVEWDNLTDCTGHGPVFNCSSVVPQ